MATFNPTEYLIDIKGKPYLKPAHRILWFKTENGHEGAITTELISYEPFFIVKAFITISGVLVASAYGMAQPNTKAVYAGRELEKAETAAIGRALGYAGYGTQFGGDDETEHLADSPLDMPQNAPKQGQGSTQGGDSVSSQGGGKISHLERAMRAIEHFELDYSKFPPPVNAAWNETVVNEWYQKVLKANGK